MGCSASRPSTFITKNNYLEDNPLSSAAIASSASATCLDNSTVSSQYCSSPAVPRALSLQTPLVHHPPSKKGDSHHLVSLTSTTYGSLLIDPITTKLGAKHCSEEPRSPLKSTKNTLLTQIPADPGDSLSPDSVINTWELMDGLDDDKDYEMGVEPFKESSLLCEVSSKITSFQNMGFDGNAKKLNGSLDSVKSEGEIVNGRSFSSSRPLWKHLSEESLLSNMDPNVASSYRRALSSRQLGCDKVLRDSRSVGSSPITFSTIPKNGIFQDGTEEKIVLYFTSLRGIRKTYEDCYAVRMIFRGFRVSVDERDISMDSTYRKELQNVLKEKAISLPQVFIGGKHVGGVEEIRQLHEIGELAKLLEGFPVRDQSLVCETCGDARFVPCFHCNGSRKVFDEEEERLRRCISCNENGLIRCPGCCSS